SGHLVALLVDRVQAGDTAERVPFFGNDAPFPRAPWLIASVLRVPVVLAFGLYRGGNRYDLAFESFSDGLHIPRAERASALTSLIQRYATRLEHYARLAPFNWFNFYDFWDPADDVLPDRATPTVAPARAIGVEDRAAGTVDPGDIATARRH